MLVCEVCNKEFEVKPSRAKKAKFCSVECSRIGRTQERVNVICKACGKSFKVSPTDLKFRPVNYCSRRCRDEGRKNKVKTKCLYCGKLIETFPANIKAGRGKYCSKDCFYEAKKNKVKKICPICGEIFYIKPHHDKRTEHNYCSTKCYHSVLKGEKHPSWKGGISFEPYCSKFNGEFKERVREFWDYKCGLCGKSQKENEIKLAVHHVNYEKMVCCNDTPPLFMPLCKTCHTKTNWNRTFWESILTEYIMIYFDGNSYLLK